MLEKKAYIDVPKIIVITILSAFIFIYFLIVLSQNADLTIDEKKINTQLVLSKLFNGKCFSEDFATFEESKFTEENLNNCFKNLNDKTLFRIQVSSSGNYLYPGNSKDEFETKKNYCNQNSNVLCSRMIYPITFIAKDNSYSTPKLLVEIITF